LSNFPKVFNFWKVNAPMIVLIFNVKIDPSVF
jgi:hypothetical protein